MYDCIRTQFVSDRGLSRKFGQSKSFWGFTSICVLFTRNSVGEGGNLCKQGVTQIHGIQRGPFVSEDGEKDKWQLQVNFQGETLER